MPIAFFFFFLFITLWRAGAKLFSVLIILSGFTTYSVPGLAETQQPVEKVSLQLKWLHAFQFAGYYAAKEKGFYAAEGLEVDIRQRIPHVNHVEQVMKGESEYGVADSGLLLERLKGKTVVVLASVFQHNPLVYVTLKSSNMISPKDFKGKRIMDDLTDRIPLLAMCYEAGISTKEFTHVDYSFNLDDVTTGKVDASAVYLTDELDYFRQKKIEINILDPRNYGVDFLGDNLFTTEQEIRQHPERVQRFLRASLKGWDYALKHPEEIIELILKKYNSDKRLTAEHLRFEATETAKLILPDTIPLGSTDTKRFQRIAETYLELGLVKSLDNLQGFIYQQALTSQLKFSHEEKAWLQAHPVIRLGIDRDFAPYEWVNSKGDYVGLTADFTQQIEQRLGVKLEIVKDKPWAEVLAMAKRGEVDVLSDVNKTPQRDQYLNFTEPYVEMAVIIVNHEKNGFIGNLAGLKGKKVAVENSYFMQERLLNNHPEIQLISANSTYDALMMVNSGQADAYIGDAAIANYTIRKYGLINLRFSGDSGEKSQHRMAATKKNPLLLDILVKTLDSIPDYEKQVIQNRWMSLQVKPGINTETLIRYGIAALVIFFVVMFWNMSLQREIKQRKQMAAALREKEEYLQKIVSCVPGIVFQFRATADGHYSFPYCSEGVRSIYHLSPEDVSEDAAPLFARLHPDDLNGLALSIQQSERDLTPWLYMYRVRYDDGSSIWLRGNSIPQREKDGSTIWHGFAIDISEIKQAEQAMREAELKANLANQAKSEFLANMSHEIRTPMNGVIGMTHLLQRTELSEKQKNYLAKIEKSAQSLLYIINDILDFSKIEAGKLKLEKEAFLLTDVLNNLLAIVEHQAQQKGIELILNQADFSEYLIGDALRLGQILINLVSNAIKFTETGRVIVSVIPETVSEQAVQLQFSVQDTGIGISAEKISGLFQSFSQEDSSITRKYGGSGLGLVICKQLVEMMQGRIWVESEQGKGSIFRFTVTLETAKTMRRISDGSSAENSVKGSTLLSGRKVLLVEDNEINRELATALLTDLGLLVEVAKEGREAVDRIFTEAFDLIIMDIQMPVMDGLTATRLIRADGRFNNLPIIAMTANAMTGDKETSLAAGMNDHLTKPIMPEKLTAVLTHWLTGQTEDDTSGSVQIPTDSAPQVVEKTLPDYLPPFNIAEALRRMNNNRKLLHKVLLMFRDEYADSAPKLKNLILEGQHQEAKRFVHSLKGVVASLGAAELEAVSTELETAFYQQETLVISPALMQRLEKALEVAVQAVAALDES